uniref:Ribosomal protein L16 n=1 Tax=Synura synuroidea TaxID=47573 RepID=Q9MG97_9STRA|nr:ribosomal protein L16 [Synura synuroidea]AAF36952.1 ribosomal protein L16 [Synura synuroidea]
MNLKYKKQQKGKFYNRINSKPINIFNKNKYNLCLRAKDFGKLTINEIKAFKQNLIKKLKKNFVLVRFYFNPITPITKKPIEVRMGKGKGSVNYFVMKIKPGTMLCKIECLNFTIAKKTLMQAKIRLSIKTQIYC